jgi:hypothetical protein
MALQEENFLEEVLEKGFDLLNSEKIKWPRALNKQQRLILIDTYIQYFTEREDYSKCAVLTTIKESILSTKKRT